VTQQDERQVRTKRWVCHVCAEHAPEYPTLGLPGCTGKPVRGYEVDGLPVCATAAIYHANMEYRKHGKMISDLAGHSAIHEGRTKSALRSLLARFREAIPLELSGANTGGVANLTSVSNRIADFLAEARFIICSDLLQGAKRAVEELASRLPEGKARAIQSILETAEGDLEPSSLDPTKLSVRDRRAYWGAAKRASVFLLGDPKKSADTLEVKIHRIGGSGFEASSFLREFRVRQLMAALKLPREEAEQVAEKGLGGLRAIAEETQVKKTPEQAPDEQPAKAPKAPRRRKSAKAGASRATDTDEEKKPRGRRATTPTASAQIEEEMVGTDEGAGEGIDPRMTPLATALKNGEFKE